MVRGMLGGTKRVRMSWTYSEEDGGRIGLLGNQG